MYDMCFGSVLRVFRKIPNGEFLIKFGSLIFDPLWGPTAELNGGGPGGGGGGAPSVRKVRIAIKDPV